MKKYIFAFSFILLFLNNSFALDLTKKEQEYISNNKTILMCIDPNWMPFERLDSRGRYLGMSADYFKIFEEILELNFKVVPSKNWSESLVLAKNRTCDILALAMKTPSREKYLKFTSAYLDSPLVITTKPDVKFIENIKDLEGKKIGIPNDYAFYEILKNRYPNLNIIGVSDIDEGLQKVSDGEFFAYIGTIASVGYKFQTKFSGELKIAGKVEEKLSLGIGVRNDDEVLFSILQKAVQSLSFEQKREILNKWVSITYEKGTDYSLLIKIVLIALAILLVILYFLNKQVRLKNEIAQQKEEFESIFRNAKDGIAILDLDSNYIDFNDSYLEMTGFTRQELLQKSCISLTSPEYLEDTKRAFYHIFKYGEIKDFEKACVVKGQKRIIVNMSGSLLRQKQKILITVKDITTSKLIEEQARLVSMGEMIGNIAHQWRQPLSIISVSASGAKIKLELENKINKEFLCESFHKIVEQTKYLSKTIDDFRDFIKGDKSFLEINLSEVISSSLNLVESSLKNNYIKTIISSNDDFIFYGNKNEFEQALINIFNNAKDALKENIEDEENRFLFIESKKEDENTLELLIYDNAGGISEEILDRIFEPYFTTKHQSVGTGLGLSMAYKIIVERHEENLNVYNKEFVYENKKFKGACFRVLFKKTNL